jgi:hypothetical protein
MGDDSIVGVGLPHRYALFVAYAIVMLVWGRVARRLPSLWPQPTPAGFARPWREVGFYFAALAVVLLVGQLYVRQGLIPAHGPLEPVLDAANQFLIFTPVLALPFVRRRALVVEGADRGTTGAAAPPAAVPATRAVLAGMWLPTRRVWARAAVGAVLSLIAILVFTSVRSGSDPFVDVSARVFHPRNLGNFVQVLCEDVAIAVLFVRVRAALGLWRTIAVVAVFFAAAHIPVLVAGGAALGELAGLVADAGLGAMVLYFVQRSADVWWFWWIHFAMDMMQFHAVPGETL